MFLASHADVLRGSSRVPVGQERVTNPQERLRGRLVFISFKPVSKQVLGAWGPNRNVRQVARRGESAVQILNKILLVN